MVGGNGPNVTWRLAAKYADELNLDGLTPDDVRDALPVIRGRCEEIGRDPASLTVSVHVWWESLTEAGEGRAEMVAAYRDLGVSRLICMIRDSAQSDDALAAWADDCRAGGAEVGPSTAIGA
jgi:alkanesulfonate monooxygenase SsuD/methylene tetrahydromethanopterin reductase-like flavin-dependent oxidoreductase (luciferase family)